MNCLSLFCTLLDLIVDMFLYTVSNVTMQDRYGNALKTARAELFDLTEQRKVLDERITQLRRAILGLIPLAQSEVEEEGTADTSFKALEHELNREMGSLGITDACREALKIAGEPLTPIQVRDRVLDINPDLAKQSNLMASVHTVLKRLEPKEATALTDKEGNLFYKWVVRSPKNRQSQPR
jgi:hypothetical protein